MTTLVRKKVLITGAAGGMGRACARLFGATHDLVLNDVAEGPLNAFTMELKGEGFTVVAAYAGDLCDDTVLSAITKEMAGDAPFAVIHTAGLSPSLSDWQSIMTVNLIGSEKLLNALEPSLVAGSVAVLIASSAGHAIPAIAEADALLDAPLAPGFINDIGTIVRAMTSNSGGTKAGGISYSFSKRGMLRQVERKAALWGKSGARIVSISPGLILTPMGRKELAETPGAQTVNDAAPAGRSGTAMDIALAAQFLASSEASFITGTDLRVDGGSVAAMRT